VPQGISKPALAQVRTTERAIRRGAGNLVEDDYINRILRKARR
jgi:hypothetical protein